MVPVLIGLTGGVGVGKSTAARVLAELGAEVVSGDELGRRVLENSPEMLAEVRARFGGEVFEADGTLLRRVLGELVFANREHARWLTELTFAGIHRWWREAVARSTREVVVFDAALIFEWGIEREFDLLLSITASPDHVLRRQSRAGRLTMEEIESRLAAQLPPANKARQSHVDITNDGTIEELEDAVRDVWHTRIAPELQKRRKTGNDPLR
jgi:dephospho-CoA kinase